MGHIHAAVMAEYAKDALETDKPLERWEFFHKSGNINLWIAIQNGW